MNKKGFTLVEILGTLLILGFIIVLVFPSVTKIIIEGKKNVFDIQLNKILTATYDYTLKNISFLPDDNETKYITLNQLKKENLVDSDIKESNEKLFQDDLVISIKKQKKINDIDKYSIKRGDYLYTVEIARMKTDDFNKKRPTISFEGYNTDPIVVNLNIKEEYVPLKYSSISFDGKDLTEYVIENITYNSKKTNEVDTSVAGIYYLNYTVVDLEGYSNLAKVNIIVLDNEKPNLEVPENETISISTTSYDLMEGTSCTDNSDICNISVNGNINFGVSGKYIIEYIAKDPSGNTTILKRVITVE